MAASSKDLAVAYLRGKAAEYRRLSGAIRHAATSKQLARRARDYEIKLAQLEAMTAKPACTEDLRAV